MALSLLKCSLASWRPAVLIMKERVFLHRDRVLDSVSFELIQGLTKGLATRVKEGGTRMYVSAIM